MRSLSRNQAADFLLAQDHFAILTHRRPDGDTLGSAALLCRGLRRMGKTAHVLENPEVTAKYTFLNEGLTKPQPEDGDVLVSVDVATAQLLPQCYAHLADRIDLRIDHHRNPELFGRLEVVDPISAACGQIIFDIFRILDVELDEPMALALYTAIATDTGCFRYANAQPQTYETAAACARATPHLRELNHKLFETVSLARLRLQGWMVENALFLQNGQVCICAIPLEVEQQLGLTEDDMENISGFPRTIEGVKIAATLRQEADGRIKISMRAVLEYDASVICAKFGGGGHRGAAGASMNCSMEEAVEAVKNAIPTIE